MGRSARTREDGRLIRPLIIESAGVDPRTEIALRVEFARARAALRRTGPGSSDLCRDEHNGIMLSGGDPSAFVIEREFLVDPTSREEVAGVIDAVLASEWNPDATAIHSALRTEMESALDVLDAIGQGINGRIGLRIATPAFPARFIVTGSKGGAHALSPLVDHLLASLPYHLRVAMEDGRARMIPVGARILQGRPCRDPVTALRRIADIPPEMITDPLAALRRISDLRQDPET